MAAISRQSRTGNYPPNKQVEVELKHPFNNKVMSNVKCSRNGCNRLIKANVVGRKTSKALLCYEHWCESNGINPKARKINRKNHNRRVDKAEKLKTALREMSK